MPTATLGSYDNPSTQYLTAAYEAWCLEFLATPTVPMDQETSSVFIHCSLGESAGDFSPPLLAESLPYKISSLRANVIGLNVTPAVLCFLIFIANGNPGSLVMYVHALRHRVGDSLLTMTQLSYIFPMGVPSQDALTSLWCKQKLPKFGNLLDWSLSLYATDPAQ